MNNIEDSFDKMDLGEISPVSHSDNISIAPSLLRETEVIDRINFKEIDPGRSSYNYIYHNSSARLTQTLRKILEFIYERNKQVSELHGLEIHPDYLLTLNMISEMIKSEQNLNEKDKSNDVVNSALSQMLDLYNSGNNKIGYLYPYILIDGNRYSPKIAVISPQLEKETSISDYRRACFLYSLDAIHKILNYQLKNNTESSEPIYTMLFSKKKGDEQYMPEKGSIEYRLHGIVKQAFYPYSYIPMDDFVQDVLEYGIEVKKVIQLSPDYHICDSPLSLNSDGSFKTEPEILFQLRCHYYALRYFLTTQLKEEANDLGYKIFILKIEEFEKVPVSKDFPMPDDSLMEKLIDLAYSFPFNAAQGDKLKSYKDRVEFAIHIIKGILKQIKDLDIKKDITMMQNNLSDIESKIKEHCKNKKTLYVLDLDNYITNTGIKDKKLLLKIEQSILSRIQKEYGFIETHTADAKRALYIADPFCVTAIVHNLQVLSLQNESYLKQYEYSQYIEDRLKQRKFPGLNKNINPEELKRLKAEIEKLEYDKFLARKKEEFKRKFNIQAAIAAGVLTYIFAGTLYSLFKNEIILILGVPISIISALASSIVFSYNFKHRDSLEEEAKDDNDKLSESVQSILNAAESYIFKSDFNSIEEKFFDRKSLRNTILNNLEEIKSKSPYLAKEKNEEKLISSIENAIMFHSSIILIPKDIVVKNKSDIFIVNKSDMRSSLFRSQMAEYFKYQLAMAKEEEIARYYKFIINALEVDYARYLYKAGKNIPSS